MVHSNLTSHKEIPPWFEEHENYNRKFKFSTYWVNWSGFQCRHLFYDIFSTMNFQSDAGIPTSHIESILSTLLETLDATPSQNTPPLQQLVQQPRIILNGEPFGSKEQFQSLWASLPLSNHSVTSLDAHQIPSTNNFIILAHLKVRFDESGRNKLGDSTTNLQNSNGLPIGPSNTMARPIWSHWFGVSLTCILDSSFLNNKNGEFISTWDYRFTEKPTSSIYQIM